MIDDRRHHRSRKRHLPVHVIDLHHRDRFLVFHDLQYRDSLDANSPDFLRHKRESPFSQKCRYLVRALHPRPLISDTQPSDAAGHSVMRGPMRCCRCEGEDSRRMFMTESGVIRMAAWVRQRANGPADTLARDSECALPDRPPVSPASALARKFLRASTHAPATFRTDQVPNRGYVVCADTSLCHLDHCIHPCNKRISAVQNRWEGTYLCALQERVRPRSYRSRPGPHWLFYGCSCTSDREFPLVRYVPQPSDRFSTRPAKPLLWLLMTRTTQLALHNNLPGPMCQN